MSSNLVIIPTYNEAGNLEGLLRKLRTFDQSHVLIVDDNSPDGTGKIAEQLKNEIQGLHVMHRSGKLGIGSAHIAGLRYAQKNGFETALTMDCDFTHNPKYIPELLQTLRTNELDVVVGSRYHAENGISDWHWARKLITRTAHLLTTVLLGLKYDATGGLRVYRLRTLPFDRIDQIKANGYAFMFEFLFVCSRARLRIGEIPVELPLRNAGVSKISKLEVLKAVFRLSALTVQRFASLRATRAPVLSEPTENML